MKKITFLLACLSFGLSAQAQLPETFDGPDLPSGWTTFIGDNGYGNTQSWVMNANGYVFAQGDTGVPAGETAEDWLVSPMISVDASETILTFKHTDYYPEERGTIYTVRVSTASQTTPADFTIVETYTESDFETPATFQTAVIDFSAYAGQDIYIAFVIEQNAGDVWFIDNVDLVADADAPNVASNPTPADGATDVTIVESVNDEGTTVYAVAFAWDAPTTGDAPTAYEVYLSDPDADDVMELNLLGATPNTSVNITGIQFGETYYWQIVPTNVGGPAVNAPVWSFTTEEGTVGIEDVVISQFKSFYNTNNNAFEVSAENAIENVTIYSILGQEVANADFNSTNASVDMNAANSGVYIAKVTVDGKSKTVKFAKN